MEVTSEQFREVMGHFATGVTVVTTRGDDGTPYGVTVNAFTSVSLDPLLVLVCLDNSLSGLEAFQESGRFGVSILSEDQQQDSNFFAKSGSDRTQHPYLEGSTGIPLLPGCLASLECRIVETFPGGDHQIIVGEVQSAELRESNRAKPLLYYSGSYGRFS